MILQPNLENLEIGQNNSQTRRLMKATPAIAHTHRQPPEIRKATSNMTINTGYAPYYNRTLKLSKSRTATPHTSDTSYAWYRHRTPPNAKSRTATPCNHHRSATIIAGSNSRFQFWRPIGRSWHPSNHHAAMVKFTTATIQAMVRTKPTGPIDKIHERPTFSTLWHLQLQLVGGLHKVVNFKFPLEGHSG